MSRGARLPGLVGLGLGLTSCVVLAFANHVIFFGIGFALAGSAMALTQYDFAWLCVRLYHPLEARKIVTGVTLFGALASAIMWPIALAFERQFGLTGAWLGLGTVMFVFGSLCLFFLTRTDAIRQQSSATTENSTVQQTELSPLPAAQIQGLVWGLVLVSVIGGGVAINLPAILHKAHGNALLIASALPLFGVGQLCARGADYLVAKHFGLRTTLMAATCATLTSWGLLIFGSIDLLVSAGVFSLGMGNGLFTIVRGATPQLLLSGAQFVEASAHIARIGSFARAALPFSLVWVVQTSPNLIVLASLCTAGVLLGVILIIRCARSALDKTH